MSRADEIAREVAARHQLEPRCLRREMPHANRYAVPRGEAARQMKSELGWSDREIGKYFGGFHPSTILSCRRPHYVKKKPGPKPPTQENLLRQLWDLRRRVEWLEQRAGLPPIKVGTPREEIIPLDNLPRRQIQLSTYEHSSTRKTG